VTSGGLSPRPPSCHPDPLHVTPAPEPGSIFIPCKAHFSIPENPEIKNRILKLQDFGNHPGMLQSGCVIYGGDQHQARTDWPVHSWQQLRTGP
jgi:hypothetical protein